MPDPRLTGPPKQPPSVPHLATDDPNLDRHTFGGDALNVHGGPASGGNTSSLLTDPTAPATATTSTMGETTRAAGTHPGKGPLSGSGLAGTGTGGIGTYEGGRTGTGSSTGPVGSRPQNIQGARGQTERVGEMPEERGGVKGMTAKLHGAGEKIRGKAGEVVDSMAGDTQGTVKNQMIQEQGRAEMDTGRFSQATKAREMGKPKTGNPPL